MSIAQAGGHEATFERSLEFHDRIHKTCTTRERLFYETVQNNYPHLVPFMPHYYGYEPLANATPQQQHKGLVETIVLQDLTFGIENACSMDAKLGKRYYDEDAMEDKKARMIAKAMSSTSWNMGVRVCGMIVNGTKYGKDYGYALKDDELPKAMRDFLSASHDPSRVAEAFVQQLMEITAALEASHVYCYGCSLLFIYDATTDNGRVHLIDFAHISPSSECDQDALLGCTSLIQALQQLLLIN
jgi:hypothetical protein